MAHVKPIPDGYSTVTSLLCVDDAAQAIAFYQVVFGATERMRLVAPDGRIPHAELVIGTSVIIVSDEYPELGVCSPRSSGGTAVSLVMYVEDVDTVVRRAVAAGAKVLRPVENRFYGDRDGRIEDPFGHVWGIATHVKDVSLAEVRRATVDIGGIAQVDVAVSWRVLPGRKADRR